MPSPLEQLMGMLSPDELRSLGMDELRRQMNMQALLRNPVEEGYADPTSPYYTGPGSQRPEGRYGGILPDKSGDRGMTMVPRAAPQHMAPRNEAAYSQIADYQRRGIPEYGGPELERAAGMGLAARGGTPVRGSKSLNKAIQEAEGDADLLRLKKLLEARGIDTGSIPAFEGL